MKTNKRLERYFLMIQDMYYLREFQIYHVISAHKVSKNVKKALIELELIKIQDFLPIYNYIGEKPTKQTAQILIDKVSSYYKKKDIKETKKMSSYNTIELNSYEDFKKSLLELSDYKGCVSGDALVYCDKVNDWKLNKDVKIINETKEQPFLLSFTWVETQKIKSLWREKIIKNYAVSNALVYATDYNNACEKLKLEYKDFEIIHIKDLAIR